MSHSFVALSPKGEEAWLALRRVSGWADDFWWVGVFADSTPTQGELRERLAAVTDLVVLAPGSAEALAGLAEDAVRHQGRDRVVWVDAGRHGLDPAWREAWDRFVMALNESRERLVRGRGGLVLVAPLAWKAGTREHAPDLWAFRNVVVDVDDIAPRPLAVPDEPGAAEPALPVVAPALEPSTSRGLALLDEAEDALVRDEPHEARRLATEALSHLEGRHRAGAARGWSALARGALEDDDPSVARGAAAHAVEHWREELAERPSHDTRRALMTAVSLLADCSWANAPTARELPSIEALRDEAVRLARASRQELGDRPDVLRDLSISLEKRGDILRDLQRPDDALRDFDEALRLRRQLREAQGERTDVLRDLSVSLNKRGRVLRGLQRLDDALRDFDESLELARQLQDAQRNRPGALRDVAAACERVGSCLVQAGREPERARALLEEAAELGETLRTRWPQLNPPYDPDIPRRLLAKLDEPEG